MVGCYWTTQRIDVKVVSKKQSMECFEDCKEMERQVFTPLKKLIWIEELEGHEEPEGDKGSNGE
jgi:hypothetical protein